MARPKSKPANCSVDGCGTAAYTKGLCPAHYRAEYKRRKKESDAAPSDAPKKVEAPVGEASEPAPELSAADVCALLTGIMLPLSLLIDESFSPVTPDGLPTPHVQMASAQMLPFIRLHASALAGPEGMFLMGCATLLMPSIPALAEIAMGRKELRIMRGRAKKKQEPVTEKDAPPASKQTVEAKAD